MYESSTLQQFCDTTEPQNHQRPLIVPEPHCSFVVFVVSLACNTRHVHLLRVILRIRTNEPEQNSYGLVDLSLILSVAHSSHAAQFLRCADRDSQDRA